MAATHAAGELRCLACGKALADRHKLAQHLKDAHDGVNAPATAPEHAAARTAGRQAGPSSTFSLGDLLSARLQRAAASPRPTVPTPAPAAPNTKSRGVQGTLKVSWPVHRRAVCSTSRKGQNSDVLTHSMPCTTVPSPTGCAAVCCLHLHPGTWWCTSGVHGCTRAPACALHAAGHVRRHVGRGGGAEWH